MGSGSSFTENLLVAPIGARFADRYDRNYVVEVLLDDGASVTYRAVKIEDDMLEISKEDFERQFVAV